MIGTGGSSLVAKTLGEKDTENANRYFTMMIKLTVVLGIVLSAVGIVFMRTAAYLRFRRDMVGDGDRGACGVCCFRNIYFRKKEKISLYVTSLCRLLTAEIFYAKMRKTPKKEEMKNDEKNYHADFYYIVCGVSYNKYCGTDNKHKK